MKKTIQEVVGEFGLLELPVEAEENPVNLDYIRQTNPFLVVCLGLGRDSVALLILLKSLDLRPDLIVFSDLGMEKDSTYAYLPVLEKWLAAAGFPPVEVIKASRLRDLSFEHHLFRLGIFPSLAYGKHRCSVMWKIEVIDEFLNRHPAFQNALLHRREVVKCVGFEKGEEYRAERKKSANGASFALDPGQRVWFPLIEHNLTLTDCIRLIEREIGSVPPKSSCYLCPAMKPDEIEALEQTEPEKFFKALVLEYLVQHNTVVLPGRVQGLSFGKKWSELAPARKYLPAVETAVAGFKLERTLQDGLRHGEHWKGKARRVDLFLQFFNQENLALFLSGGVLPAPLREQIEASFSIEALNPDLSANLLFAL